MHICTDEIQTVVSLFPHLNYLYLHTVDACIRCKQILSYKLLGKKAMTTADHEHFNQLPALVSQTVASPTTAPI
jgi:hypothetical protein